MKYGIFSPKSKKTLTAHFLCAVLLIFSNVIILASLVHPSLAGSAEAATEINYQGKLMTSSNVAVPDGIYNMEFKLYTVSSGGTAIWTETRTGGNRVQVTNGLFSVLLGSVSSLAGINFDQAIYLGVNIGGTASPSWDGEMSPRKKFASVPTAFVADTAKALDATNATSTNLRTTNATSTNFYAANLTASTTNVTGTLRISSLTGLLVGTNGSVSAISTSTLGLITTDIAEGTNLYFTNERADARIGLASTTIRNMFSSSATGLTYTAGTGDLALAVGYTIPLTASTTEWASKVSSQWITSGANIYYNTGDVGIGSTTPSAKLAITGTAGTADIFAVASSTNARLFTIKSTGNVGIGTTTPGSNLTVQGTGSFTGALSSLSISSGAIVSNWDITVGETRGLLLKNNASIWPNGVGNIVLYDNAGTSFGRLSFGGTTSSFPAIKRNGAGIDFRLADDSGFATISAHGGIFNGSVGIGTTTPAARLHIQGSTDIPQLIVRANSTQTSNIQEWQGSNGSTTLAVEGNGTLFRSNLANATKLIRFTDSTGREASIQTYTLGAGGQSAIWFQAESVRFSNGLYLPTRLDGNAGVAGTTLIANSMGRVAFEVSATLKLVSSLSSESVANIARAEIHTTSAGQRALIVRGFTSQTANLQEWQDAASSSLSVVTANGSFGIGTTTPGSKLVVVTSAIPDQSVSGIRSIISGNVGDFGSTYGVYAEVPDADSDGPGTYAIYGYAPSIYFGSAGVLGTGGYQGVRGEGHIGVSGYSNASGGQALYALQDNSSGYSVYAEGGRNYFQGSVGIGTTTPSAKLAITGTAGTADIFTVASSTNARLFTVKSTGNVGIGTSTPTDKLTVAGSATVTGYVNALGFLGNSVSVQGVDTVGLEVYGNMELQGIFYDGLSSAGTAGMVLQTTGTGTKWVATSTLGISGGSSSNYLTLGSGFLATATSTDAIRAAFFVATSTTATSTFAGAVGIGTTTPGSTLVVAGNAHITGPLRMGTGTSPVIIGDVTGNTRNTNSLDMQAFRVSAGQVASGVRSTAVGNRNTVTGTDSSAFGAANTTAGLGATALGHLNQAAGQYATALGVQNIASTYGLAAGYGNYAGGTESSAIGSTNTVHGYVSYAFGKSNTISADSVYSIALGFSNAAYASYSYILGDLNETSDDYTIAIGYQNVLHSYEGIAIGYRNSVSVSGTYSPTVIGTSNAMSGWVDYSTIVGYANGVYSAYSGSFGYGNNVYSQTSYAFGYGNSVNGGSATFAFGGNISNSTGGSLMIGPNNSAKLTILSTGFTGIGTTTPMARLAVTGTAGTSDVFIVASSTNAQLLTVKSTGNIGIGTTTPSAKLAITGTAGTADIFTVASSTNARLFTIKSTGNVGIGTSTPGARLSINAGNTNTYFTVNPIENDAQMSFGGSANTRFMMVNSNPLGFNQVLFTTAGTDIGYVGASSNVMRLQGGANTTVGVGNSGAVNIDLGSASVFNVRPYDHGSEAFTVNRFGRVGVNNNSPQYAFDQKGLAGINPFNVASSTGTSLFAITQNGNVGIGTTTPTHGLTIVDPTNYGFEPASSTHAIRIDSSGSWGSPGILFTGSSNGAGAYNGASIEALSRTGGVWNLAFKLGNSLTEVMTLRSTGNVGIGTSSPSHTLTVAGDINFTGNIYQNGVLFTADGGAAQWITHGVDIASYNAGNVGIGTDSPAAKLSVQGSLSEPPVLAYASGVDASSLTATGTVSGILSDVFVSGNYAFVAKAALATNCNTANNKAGCELQIYDVSNPATPVYVGGADAAGAANAGVGNVAFNSVFVSGNYAYIGKAAATTCDNGANRAGCEFQIWDVSDPSNPVYQSGIDASGSVNSGAGSLAFRTVFVSGNYAFVAKLGNATNCNDGSTKIGCELHIYNVSSSTAPSYVTGIDASGQVATGTTNSAFNDVFVSGNYMYIAKANATTCDAGANRNGCELQIWDVSNPASPVFVSGADSSGATNSGAGSIAFNAVVVRNGYAYVGQAGNNSDCGLVRLGCELKIFNVSNPANPVLVGGADSSGTANGGTSTLAFDDLFISGKYLYVTKGASAAECSLADGTGCELMVFDISNPAVPRYVAGADASGSVNAGFDSAAFNDVFVANGHVFITKAASATNCNDGGTKIGCEMQTYSLTGSADPTTAFAVAGSSVFTGTAKFSNLGGDNEYLTIHESGYVGIGISTPVAPLHVKTLDPGGLVGRFEGQYGGYTTWNNGSSDVGYVGSAAYFIAANTASEFGMRSAGNLTFAAGGNTEWLRITSGGNVGIGTSTPAQKLSVAGTIFASNLLGGATTLSTDANGNIIRSPSDESLKENINTIEGALDKVMQLRGVSYEWLDKARFGTSTEIGVIAQEVEQVVPEVVSSGGEYKSVKIANLVGLLIEAVKELKVKVDGIAKEVKNGIVYFAKISVEGLTVGSREKPAGITIYDETTNEPYCLKMKGGSMVSVPGKCGTVPAPAPTVAPDPVTIPDEPEEIPAEEEADELADEDQQGGGDSVTPPASGLTTPPEEPAPGPETPATAPEPTPAPASGPDNPSA